MVLADYDLDRARRVQARVGAGESGRRRSTFPVERVDARDQSPVVALAREARRGPDHERGRPALHAGSSTAPSRPAWTTWTWPPACPSRTRPTPSTRSACCSANHQFAKHDQWQAAGRLAILGMGMDPGLTDVFARYAADELFDEIDEVHIRDGGDLRSAAMRSRRSSASGRRSRSASTRRIIWERGRGCTRPSRSRRRRHSSSPRASGRSNASTSSTRR